MRYIREKFNSEKLAEQVEKLYDQMISREGKASSTAEANRARKSSNQTEHAQQTEFKATMTSESKHLSAFSSALQPVICKSSLH